MAAPEPSKPIHSATQILHGPQELGFEADFADLASRFAAKSGGGLSAELSAELALEIVLNEIVEQACQITGATGAAIIVDRDGELVCRASSGSTAPELGARIDKSVGLAAESLRSGKTLWCDDTFTDSRADADPLKQLGIRSVVIMPLVRSAAPVGVVELFSTQAYAFGVRDERTLESLADRTLTNLEHAAQPLEVQGELISPAADLGRESLQRTGVPHVILPNDGLPGPDLSGIDSNIDAGKGDSAEFDAMKFDLRNFPPQNPSSDAVWSSANPDAEAGSQTRPPDFAFPDVNLSEITPEDLHALLENAGVITSEPEPTDQQVAQNIATEEKAKSPLTQHPQFDAQFRPGLAPPLPVPAKPADYLSWALGFTIISVAVLLGLVLGQHFVLSHQPAAGVVPAVHAPLRPAKSPDPAPVQSASAVKATSEKPDSRSKSDRSLTSSRERSASSEQTVPPGGLLVLENGKEVFRMPPSENPEAASGQQVVQPASELEADPASQQVLDVPEAAAQRELLHRVEPDYPEAARQQDIQGRVVLEVHIGVDGSVQDVETVSGSEILAQASTDAVKQWKFKPRVVDGRPREMQTRVTFDFKLPQ